MSKRIQDDNDYVRPIVTEQDRISMDTDMIYDRVKGLIKLPKENYGDVPTGVWIKYVSYEGKFRNGGMLIKNGAPDYFVLKNIGRKITWSVNLKKNVIFMEDFKKRQLEKIEKNKLYELFKKGYVTINLPPGYNDDDDDDNDDNEDYDDDNDDY